MRKIKITDPRKRRQLRGRKKLLGTKDRPRLCVYRGNKNFTAQLIDDVEGKTLLSVSTLEKSIKKNLKSKGNIAASKVLGKLLAEKAQAVNIKQVKFDKSGYLYHGRVKEFAQACRENGLVF